MVQRGVMSKLLSQLGGVLGGNVVSVAPAIPGIRIAACKRTLHACCIISTKIKM